MDNILKQDYLLLCIKKRQPIFNFEWYKKVFTTVDLIDEQYDEHSGEYDYLDVVIKPTGLHFIDEDWSLVKFSDYLPGKPLFDYTDEIKVDSSVMSNIKGNITTTIGRLLINAVITTHDRESKYEFINRAGIDVDTLQDMFADALANDRTEVSEMKDSVERMAFLDGNGFITSISATEKAITPAPGMKEFKEKLVKEAGDSINDKVKYLEIENKIQAYDREYLKDDPVAQNLYGRKASVGRLKMNAIYGEGLDFVNDPENNTLIIDSVGDGTNTDPSVFPKYINDLRYASFSRGSNTALGGSIYKELQRVFGEISVSPTPCKTTQGLVKVMTPNEVKYSVGRFYKKGSQWVVIKTPDEAKELKGKTLEMRSPMFCLEKGNSICYACLSARFKDKNNQPAIMASGISDVLLNMFLKLMHGIKTDLVKLKMDDLIN